MRNSIWLLGLLCGMVGCSSEDDDSGGRGGAGGSAASAGSGGSSASGGSSGSAGQAGASGAAGGGGSAGSAPGCAELCERADECLTQLVGVPGNPTACNDWCTQKVNATAQSACASCFQNETCSDIFKDPSAPWDITHLNPGSCIKECGLGTCELDSECSPSEICGSVGEKVECTTPP